MDSRCYSSVVTLRDGGRITLRAICPHDKDLLQQSFRRLSKQSVTYRFLGLKKQLSPAELVYLTEIDLEQHIALAATVPDAEGEQIIAIGRYIEVEPGRDARTAEVALTVVDDHQNRGIGSLLLQNLAHIAAIKGVERFEAYVLSDNTRIMEIIRQHGHDIKQTRDGDIVHVSFSIHKSPR